MEKDKYIQNLLSKISQMQRRLDFAERTAKIGYWELDLEQKKFYWSKEMYRIFGVQLQKNINHRNLIKEMLFPTDLPLYKEKLRQLLIGFEPVEGRVRLLAKDNRVVDCHFRADRLFVKGKPRIVGTFQDISDLIEREKKLEIAHEQAVKAVADRDYFLAQATHDLRQPLQAIQLFADALADDDLTISQKKVAKKIQVSVSRLRELLNNFLDISKLDSGGIKPEIGEFCLQQLICRICVEYHCFENIKVECRNRVLSICNDEVLVERVVRNLVNNAFKFAKNKVLISTLKKNNYIKIWIIDDGQGIDKCEQNKVFNDFYQVKRDDNGIGLGLGIVLRIVNVLRGKIRLRSKYGEYCAFEVKLPLNDC
ncbi:MAG: PAS domain-containing sensor histidine kinase [Alphaproteobacteria bacterium]|nr:PAS domain-containing sensor histidine kinase [Alphaproteobacteria bacterium]